MISIFLTQLFWPLIILLIVLLILPWACFFEAIAPCVGAVCWVCFLLAIALLPQAVLSPQFKTRAVQAMGGEGEAVRRILWQEALDITLDAPITGSGGGSFSVEFEQSGRRSLEKLPMTPHNDYLLILSEYGALGGVLFLLPSLLVLWRAIRHWRAEPDRVRLKSGEGAIMPPTKFFLSIGLAGVLSFALCMFSSFVFYTPALTLYGVLFFSILIKSSFRRRLRIPHGGRMRLGYLCVGLVLAVGFYSISASRIKAQALELNARQRLDQVVQLGIHRSGNGDLLNEVIELYQAAILLDPDNADAWIGLSAARCQLFYRNPANYGQIGMRASNFAQRAIELTETYWMAWAQLGIAEGLVGNEIEAEAALTRGARVGAE